MLKVNDGVESFAIGSVNQTRRNVRPKIRSSLDWFAAWLLVTIPVTNAAQTNDSPFAQVLVEAKAGASDAQFDLAVRYLNGKGATQDLAQAFNWALKAAEQGHLQAQHQLAEHYYFGIGTPTNYALAVQCYRKAAERGNSEAQFSLGVCYSRGRGIGQAEPEAETWYRSAANQGHPLALHNLAAIQIKQNRVQPSPALFEKAAAMNYAPAQYNLGLCFDAGLGVPKNASKAIDWYRKAATQGHLMAQYNLGCRSSEQDAIQWFFTAARSGYAPAQYTIGVIYYFGGYGVKFNRDVGADWVKKAAQQGHLQSIQLSKCMEIQRNVKPSIVFNPYMSESTRLTVFQSMSEKQLADEGRRNTLREANRPQCPASYSSAITAFDMTDANKLRPRIASVAFATESLKLRALEGSPASQYELGIKYLKGDGVENDRSQAVSWLTTAASHGSWQAQEKLKEMEGAKTSDSNAASAESAELGAANSPRAQPIVSTRLESSNRINLASERMGGTATSDSSTAGLAHLQLTPEMKRLNQSKYFLTVIEDFESVLKSSLHNNPVGRQEQIPQLNVGAERHGYADRAEYFLVVEAMAQEIQDLPNLRSAEVIVIALNVTNRVVLDTPLDYSIIFSDGRYHRFRADGQTSESRLKPQGFQTEICRFKTNEETLRELAKAKRGKIFVACKTIELVREFALVQLGRFKVFVETYIDRK